jgi:hypothetical protein
LPDKVNFSRHRLSPPICPRCYQETDADAIKKTPPPRFFLHLQLSFPPGAKSFGKVLEIIADKFSKPG